ncbi:MAG: extracellular solute-binding protein [Alicyclobacillus sp.]|nr:extracellular solute-binding protein [Alicyclobacillus sp.]
MIRKRLLAVAGIVAGVGGVLGSAAPVAQARSDAPITITFWNAYSTTDGEAQTITHDIIPAFEKTHPNIKVQSVTLPYGSMQSKLLTSAAGGQLPDVARLDIIWVPQLAKLGTLIPQDNLPGWKDLSKKVFAGPLSTNFYHGKYYGLPLDTNTKVLFSNTALLAKHGIQHPPKTMAEFLADIKKVSGGSGKNKVYGYTVPGTDLWQLLPWIKSFGGSVLSPDLKKADGYLNSPKTIQAITTLVNLEKHGYINGMLPGATGDMDGLAKGEYAFIDEGPWDVPALAKEYPKFKYQTSLFPAGAGGSIQVVGGEDIGIFNTDTAHEQAAWEFEKFMLSTYAQTKMQTVGQMSVLKVLPASKSLKGLSYLNIFRKQLETAASRPSIPNYQQVDNAISNAVAQAAQGKLSVKDALNQAVQQIDPLLAQNN